jgi:hypothetical protein
MLINDATASKFIDNVVIAPVLTKNMSLPELFYVLCTSYTYICTYRLFFLTEALAKTGNHSLQAVTCIYTLIFGSGTDSTHMCACPLP